VSTINKIIKKHKGGGLLKNKKKGEKRRLQKVKKEGSMR